MSQPRTGPLLAAALGCGLLAGYLTLDLLRRQTDTAAADSMETAPVVVAAANLAPGSILGPRDVRVVRWPQAALPAGHSASTSQVVGRGVILPISASEPLLQSKLADLDAGGGLPITIPRGMRAISIEVDDVIGVAGFVLPGTRVDVLVTLPAAALGGSVPGTITRVILQGVQVLAAGQRVERDLSTKPETVHVITLLVTPPQAESLALAASEGRIQLALRNTLDLDSIATGGVQTLNLLNTVVRASEARRSTSVPRSVTAPQPQAPAPPSHTVETFRGGERSVSTFAKGPR